MKVLGSKNNITSLLGCLWILATGCVGHFNSSLPEAGPTEDAGTGAGPVWIDAGPPPLPEPGLTATWDGGQADLLFPDASVYPLSEFRLQTSAVLADCRVRILDDDDRMLPNHATFERSDGGTMVELTVTRALPSKHCCRFVVDGELEELIVTSDHHLHQPLQVRFGVWPQPATDPSSGKVRHRRRRHHRSR